MTHTCSDFVVACMDFRIQETVENMLENLGDEYGQFDRVTIAGGAGNLSELITHLKLTVDLHDAKRFILTVHEDCGAGKTREDLYLALKIAAQLYPDREIRGFFIYLNGNYEEVTHEEPHVAEDVSAKTYTPAA